MSVQGQTKVRVGTRTIRPQAIRTAVRRFLFTELGDWNSVDDLLNEPGGEEFAYEMWNPAHVRALEQNHYHFH